MILCAPAPATTGSNVPIAAFVIPVPDQSRGPLLNPPVTVVLRLNPDVFGYKQKVLIGFIERLMFGHGKVVHCNVLSLFPQGPLLIAITRIECGLFGVRLVAV